MTHTHSQSPDFWDRATMIDHLRKDHGIQVQRYLDLGLLHNLHLEAHTAKVPEEAPMPEPQPEITHPHTPDQALEGPALARHLGRDHGYSSSNDLEDFTATHREMHGPQIVVDRVIAAMAGLDFDRFMQDNMRLGRHMLMEQYGAAAKRLVDWLERGGAAFLPRVATLLEEVAEANDVKHRALERLTEKLTEAGELRPAELRGATLERLARAEEAGRILQAQRDEALDRLNEADTQLSLLSGDLEAVTQERDTLEHKLVKRTQLLDQGRSDIQDLIAWIRGPKAVSFAEIVARLEKIRGGAVSTAEPIGLKAYRPSEAALGLATTGEMLEEIRTRIDLGHCGLGYRTVDGD